MRDNDYGGTATSHLPFMKHRNKIIKQSLTSISCEVTEATQRHHFATGWVFIHPLKSYQCLFFISFFSCNQLHFWCADALFVMSPRSAFLRTEVTSLLCCREIVYSDLTNTSSSEPDRNSPLHKLTAATTSLYRHQTIFTHLNALYSFYILIVIIYYLYIFDYI